MKTLDKQLHEIAKNSKNQPPQSWFDEFFDPFHPEELTDLLNRCTIGLDFLAVMRRSDGSFVQSIVNNKIVVEPYVLPYHLQATSLFLSCGKVFAREDWTKVGKTAFDYAMEHHFIHGKNACLIDDDESLSLNNALMAVIHFKLGKDGSAYMNTLSECFCENQVDRVYAPGTLTEDNKGASPIGAMVLAFFEAYKYTKDSKYLEEAHELGKHLLSKARMDSYDIWAMRLLYNSAKEEDVPKYKGQALHLVNNMNNIAMASMSAFTASIAQRANIAWMDVQPGYRDKCYELLKFQKTTQNNDRYKGAFTKTEEISDIHISYFIYNILSFMEYLVLAENQQHMEIGQI